MTDTATIAKILGRELTADEMALAVDYLIPAVTEYLESILGAKYNDENVTLTLWRDGGTKTIYIGGMQDAALTVSYVDVDGNTDLIDSTAYYREGNYLFMRDDALFLNGQRNIKIVGTYADVPVRLKLVAAHMVANMTQDKSTGEAKSESIGDYSITYADVERGISPQVQDLLAPLRPLRLA